MSATYGQTIRWNGITSPSSISVKGFETHAEAIKEAVSFAWDMGWRPRRWWQAHRWFEHRLPAGWRAHLPSAA